MAWKCLSTLALSHTHTHRQAQIQAARLRRTHTHRQPGNQTDTNAPAQCNDMQIACAFHWHACTSTCSSCVSVCVCASVVYVCVCVPVCSHRNPPKSPISISAELPLRLDAGQHPFTCRLPQWAKARQKQKSAKEIEKQR